MPWQSAPPKPLAPPAAIPADRCPQRNDESVRDIRSYPALSPSSSQATPHRRIPYPYFLRLSESPVHETVPEGQAILRHPKPSASAPPHAEPLLPPSCVATKLYKTDGRA